VSAALFDTHCHLDANRYHGDVDGVLARARAAGVTRLCAIGLVDADEPTPSAAGAESMVALARANHDWIVAAVGLHPHDARVSTDALLAELEQLARDPQVVAVGETGLDFHYDHSPRDVQREVFRRFVDLAKRVKKPLVIHTREAAEDTLAILYEEGAREVGGIIHCFSEDPNFAKCALELNFVSSFSGIVTFKTATAVREAARLQPIDAILVETDAPYLAPVPYRGKRNEPAYVTRTADVIAELRGISVEEVRAATTRNACRVFGIAVNPPSNP
jgi:TatD DNase family protein